MCFLKKPSLIYRSQLKVAQYLDIMLIHVHTAGQRPVARSVPTISVSATVGFYPLKTTFSENPGVNLHIMQSLRLWEWWVVGLLGSGNTGDLADQPRVKDMGHCALSKGSRQVCRGFTTWNSEFRSSHSTLLLYFFQAAGVEPWENIYEPDALFHGLTSSASIAWFSNSSPALLISSSSLSSSLLSCSFNPKSQHNSNSSLIPWLDHKHIFKHNWILKHFIDSTRQPTSDVTKQSANALLPFQVQSSMFIIPYGADRQTSQHRPTLVDVATVQVNIQIDVHQHYISWMTHLLGALAVLSLLYQLTLR